jgi:hypothetical protein
VHSTSAIGVDLVENGDFADMALTYPVDGWEVVGGTWGTDIDEDTSVHKTGGRSVKWLTAVGAELWSEEFIPIEGGKEYLGEIESKSSSTTAGHIYNARVYWYTEAKVAASTASSDIRATAVAPDTNWNIDQTIVAAPSDARYAKLRAAKAAQSFTLNLDRFKFVRAIPSWSVQRDAAYNQPVTGTAVPFDTENRVVGVTHSSGLVTIAEPGFYVFSGSIRIPVIANGKLLLCSVVKNSSTVIVFGQPMYNRSGVNSDVVSTVAGHAFLGAGDTVEMYAQQSDTGAKAITAGAWTQFSGALVEK